VRVAHDVHVGGRDGIALAHDGAERVLELAGGDVRDRAELDDARAVPDGNVTLDALGGGAGIDLVQRELFTLSPQTDAQRWLHSNALQFTNTIALSRWTTVEQIGSRFPWPFFMIVVFWLAIIFASFGVFAPRNASVTAALFVAALGLAGAIFMILEMDQPYRGLVKIPSTSLRVALDQLGRS